MKLTTLALIVLLGACGSNDPHDGNTTLMLELEAMQAERIDEGMSYVDNEHGWITPTDCDGYLWSSKFGSYFDGFDPTASEYEKEPGRFGRASGRDCYLDESGPNGSASSWSRDMGISLISYAWKTKNLSILERHRDYVVSNNNYSGEPRNFDRTYYSPALLGLLHQVIYALGGPNNQARHVPNIYTSGLNDYRAHLQMLDIWLRGETFGTIDNIMLARIAEHSEREPNNAFYQTLKGRWFGDYGDAIRLCLNHGLSVAEYVRCDRPEACRIAEEAWSCGLLINYLTEA